MTPETISELPRQHSPSQVAEHSRSGFDRIARAYRWLEYASFGPLLGRCREAYLQRMTGCRNALVLGDGDGRFTAKLLVANASLRIVAIDISAAMLAQLRRRAGAVGAADRVITVRGDIVELLDSGRSWSEPAANFDLAVSHFLLDCLSTAEVSAVADGVRARLAPGGQWIISEFEVPSLAARVLVALLYKGFALLAGLRTQHLPAYREALERLGWECVEERRFGWGLLSSTAWTPFGHGPDIALRDERAPGAVRQPRSGLATPTLHMTLSQVSTAFAHPPYLLDTIPGIDPGPVPSPVPGLDPDPIDPETEPDYDPDVDPDPVLPPGPDTPGPDPGFPVGPFSDPITT